MQLSDFSFDLPDELIARYPLESRSASRLLHIDDQGHYHDHSFTDILDLLNEGDLLVLNDTKVMKARLKGKRATGGAIEVLVERMLDTHTAHCHIKSSNSPKAGAELYIGEDSVPVTVQGRHENLFVVEFSQPILSILDQYGQLPIPLISIVKQKKLIQNDIKRFSTILKKLLALLLQQQVCTLTKIY
jgi:S-adenosylmethionine:tRNA ribosyltransferase-isomerase